MLGDLHFLTLLFIVMSRCNLRIVYISSVYGPSIATVNLRITQWGIPLNSKTILKLVEVLVQEEKQTMNPNQSDIYDLISTILLVHTSQPWSAHIVENTKKLKITQLTFSDDLILSPSSGT